MFGSKLSLLVIGIGLFQSKQSFTCPIDKSRAKSGSKALRLQLLEVMVMRYSVHLQLYGFTSMRAGPLVCRLVCFRVLESSTQHSDVVFCASNNKAG